MDSSFTPGGQDEGAKTLSRTARRRHQKQLKFEITILRVVVLAAALAAIEIQAADQIAGVQYSSSSASLLTPRNEPVLFGERFVAAFDERSAEVFADRLHAFNALKWSFQLSSGDPENYRERTTSAAREAFSKSIAYSARDTIVDLPLLEWLERRQEWLASLLRYSLDDIGEEAVAPLDISYRLVERSWWKSLLKNDAIRYGIRPFRTSPYAFTSFALKNSADEVLLLGHLRYYYHHFSDHRFEVSLSVPFTSGFSIDVGTSYQFGQRDKQERVGIKIFKELAGGGVVHFGFEVRDHPTMLAGIAFVW